MKNWRQATALKYASPSHPWKAPGRSEKVEKDPRGRGERVLWGSITLVGWSDAAFGGQLTDRKCRLGFVIVSTSSTLVGPCHISRRTSEFASRKVESSLGGEVYALREMVGHMLLLKGFFGPFEGTNPAVAGVAGCKSLSTHFRTRLGRVRIGECVLAATYGVPCGWTYRGAERRSSPCKTPRVRPLQSGAIASPRRRSLEGVSGTSDAPEFIGHVHA